MTDSQSQRMQVRDVPYDIYRAQMQNEAMEEAARLEMDKTVPGGRYLIGDVLVDANGEPVDEAADEYEDMKVGDLRAEAQRRGLAVSENAKKAELVAALEANDEAGDFANSENPPIEGGQNANPQTGKTGL